MNRHEIKERNTLTHNHFFVGGVFVVALVSLIIAILSKSLLTCLRLPRQNIRNYLWNLWSLLKRCMFVQYRREKESKTYQSCISFKNKMVQMDQFLLWLELCVFFALCMCLCTHACGVRVCANVCVCVCTRVCVCVGLKTEQSGQVISIFTFKWFSVRLLTDFLICFHVWVIMPFYSLGICTYHSRIRSLVASTDSEDKGFFLLGKVVFW